MKLLECKTRQLKYEGMTSSLPPPAHPLDIKVNRMARVALKQLPDNAHAALIMELLKIKGWSFLDASSKAESEGSLRPPLYDMYLNAKAQYEAAGGNKLYRLWQ